jgi:hypothetical protein
MTIHNISLFTYCLKDLLFSYNNSITIHNYSVCLFLVRQPPVGQGLIIREFSRSHTTTHRIQ